MSKYDGLKEQWRARKWALGLCGRCGKQPLATSKKTGAEILMCRACADKQTRKVRGHRVAA